MHSPAFILLSRSLQFIESSFIIGINFKECAICKNMGISSMEVRKERFFIKIFLK